ncbi:MAG TPA: hypothetical protein VNJ54_06835 [Plantibacter sp.]|uniref:hypothetical protein n=1 Tax=unclassified Plantibacter TaxID=2624265 RepID=UPI002BD53D92|nr:hypothetical protein [Plantibacter sp.]
MTTDLPTGDGVALDRRRAFGRVLAIVLVVLVAIGGGAALIGLTQGPKLVRTVVDPTGLVESWGQRVVLAVNQPIAPLDTAAVSVEPSADFELSAADGNITLTFPQPLAYATEYRITVDGVRAPGGGPAATIATAFSTPAAQGFSLVRSPAPDGGSDATKRDDRIVRLALDGADPVIAYEAPKIQEFATVGDRLIVVDQEAGGLSRIVVVDTTDGSTEEVELPMGGMVTSLQTAPAQSRVGFLFTEQSFGRDGGDNLTLYSFELRDGDVAAAPERVGGIDGEPVQAAEWSFVPRTASMLVRTVDNSLELLDPSAATPPVLLGRASLISSYIPGTTKVVVEQVDGVVVLDLATGESVPFVLPSVAPTEIPGQLVALSDSLSARIYADYDREAGTTEQRVLAIKDGATAELYTPDDGAVVWSLCASPNAEYVAVVVIPDFADAGFDGYANAPMPNAPRIDVVDARTGTVVGSQAGFDLSWCAGTGIAQ